VLLLYNAFGYYGLLAYEMNRSRQSQLMELPDDAFMVIKIPAALYLHAEDTDFEYLNESISHNGKTYNLIKKRIQNDTLQLYTLRNKRHEQVVSQFKNYVKNHIALEKNLPQNNATKQMLQSFLKNYIAENIYILVVKPFQDMTQLHRVLVAPSDKLTALHRLIHSPPPEKIV
jgi:hypothetical protein